MPTLPADALLARKLEFQTALLDWFRLHQRKLPWRQSPSLYKTVVSEFMLQQTQVKTVLPYFARWMERLPTFLALAEAPEEMVLKLWEGLGYYSRARNLHRLAKAVAALPTPPQTPSEWRELPGVGPYTSAAITSIAFSYPAACVDGNVVRILSRLTADARLFRDSGSAAKEFTPLADALVPPASAGDHNQAMMELGATVCVRQSPLCTVCPVLSFCAGQRTGSPESFPRLAPKVIEQVAIARILCVRAGKLLLHRNPPDARRFANMYELPTASAAGYDETALRESGRAVATKKRGITRYAITETIYDVSKSIVQVAEAGPELVWVDLGKLNDITLSGPHRRWTEELLGKTPASS